MAPHVLIIRPNPSAQVFADRLRDNLGKDCAICLSPIMRIEEIVPQRIDVSDYVGFVITSSHAAASAARIGAAQGMECYCVGEATAHKARDAGLRVLMTALNADALADRLQNSAIQGKLLYLRGSHVASDLSKRLNRAGLETDEEILYRQVDEILTPEALALLQGNAPVILPLFSSRSAALFFEQASVSAPLLVAAISEAVAKHVPSSVATTLRIAEAPTAEAMQHAIVALASDAKRVEGGNPAQ